VLSSFGQFLLDVLDGGEIHLCENAFPFGFWCDGPGTGFDDRGVGGVVEGVEGFSGGEEVAAEGLHLTAGGGVGNDDGGGHVGHYAVTDHRGLGLDLVAFVREWGEDKETALGDGGAAIHGFGRNATIHTTRKAPDDGMRGAEKYPQALLLHRRMKATDDRDAFNSKSLAKVVGVEDQFPGALDRAKESELGTVKDGWIAKGTQVWLSGIHGVLCPVPWGPKSSAPLSWPMASLTVMPPR